MRRNETRKLEVSVDECITVSVVATGTSLKMSPSTDTRALWTQLDRNASKEIWSYTVSELPKRFRFVAAFAFSSVSSDAEYTITISGSGSGGYVRTSRIRPTSDKRTTRTFSFEVGRG